MNSHLRAIGVIVPQMTRRVTEISRVILKWKLDPLIDIAF